MKREKTRNAFHLVLLTLSVMLFTACEKHAYDFSRLAGVNEASEWGVPLLNATYSIEDIVNRFENNSVLQTNENDVLTIVYPAEFDSIVSAEEFMQFDNMSQEGSFAFSLGDLYSLRSDFTISFSDSLDLRNPYFLLQQGVLQQGSAQFLFTHPFETAGTLRITSPHLLDPSGLPMTTTIQLSPGSCSANLDLAGYTVRPSSENHIAIDVQLDFSLSGTLPPNIVITYQYSISNFKILEADVIQVNPIQMDYSQITPIKINKGNFDGNFIVYDPIIKLSVLNSFGTSARCNLETAQFTGENLPPVNLLSAPLSIEIPNAPTHFQETEMLAIPSIHFYMNYSELTFGGNMRIEPSNEVIHITRDASVSLKLSVEVPLRIDLNNVSYTDTVAMTPLNIEDENLIDELALKVAFEHTLPLEIAAQIYFCDASCTPIDSLFDEPYLMPAAYTDMPVSAPPIWVKKSGNENIKKILNSEHIIIKTGLNTSGKVDVDVNRYVKMKMGANWSLLWRK